MASFATPALTALSTLNTVRRTVGTVRDIFGPDPNRAVERQRELARERERQLTGYRQAVETRQLRDAQDLEAADRRRDLEARAERLALEGAEGERQRRRALRRAVARQRAQLGSQGISAADGSGEAILLGLVREADEDRKQSARLDRLRLKDLEADEQSAYRRNLLELTRLADRQRIERLASGYG